MKAHVPLTFFVHWLLLLWFMFVTISCCASVGKHHATLLTQYSSKQVKWCKQWPTIAAEFLLGIAPKVLPAHHLLFAAPDAPLQDAAILQLGLRIAKMLLVQFALGLILPLALAWRLERSALMSNDITWQAAGRMPISEAKIATKGSTSNLKTLSSFNSREIRAGSHVSFYNGPSSSPSAPSNMDGSPSSESCLIRQCISSILTKKAELGQLCSKYRSLPNLLQVQIPQPALENEKKRLHAAQATKQPIDSLFCTEGAAISQMDVGPSVQPLLVPRDSPLPSSFWDCEQEEEAYCSSLDTFYASKSLTDAKYYSSSLTDEDSVCGAGAGRRGCRGARSCSSCPSKGCAAFQLMNSLDVSFSGRYL